MSRRPVGSRVLWGADKIRAQRLDAAAREVLYPDPKALSKKAAERPLKYSSTEYEWCKGAFRYRWRKGVMKNGKDMSWLFLAVPDAERAVYDLHLKQRRENALRAEGKPGSRLKKRS